MNAAEIFAKIPGSFPPEKAGTLRAKFQFNLSGEGGGNWVVAIADGACTVSQGQVTKPDVSIGMTASDFVKMIAGELQPVRAFMQGKLKLQGDMNLAMKLQEIFAGASK